MSRVRAAPRQGHMDRLKRIYSYAIRTKDYAIRFRTELPDYSFLPDHDFDWTYSVYGNVHEILPDDMPEPLGEAVTTTTTMDANLNHCLVTGKSLTGCLHFVNKTPVDWYSKKQATVETATYGSEFVAATELMNTGYRMDNEMFITHLLNFLPQSEYNGAILIIKDKLRNGYVELSEIEQILEDKYQAMQNAKGCDEEEDDYALFASPSNKKKPKKAFKGCCGYCGEFGHKAADCPNKKSNQNKSQKAKNEHKKQSTKRDSKGKGHKDMSKIKCYNCGKY